MPVGLPLSLPPEVMQAIDDLADAQRDLSEQFRRFATMVEGWMKTMNSARASVPI